MSEVLGYRVESQDDGRIAVVTIDRAPNNDITPALLSGLSDLLDQLDAPSGPQVAVLQGEGRVFSKGFDVNIIHGFASVEDHRRELQLGNDVCSRIAGCRKPWIAAINGHCLGGGLEVALACHFRLCSDAARLGLPELAIGLLPGLGGIHRLTRLVGRSKALEFIVGGAMIPANEAQTMGLVNRVLPKEGFVDGVMSFARGLLTVKPDLIAEVFRLTEDAQRLGEDDCVMNTIESILRRMPQSTPAA